MISFNSLDQTPQGLEEIRPIETSDTLAAAWRGDIEDQGISDGEPAVLDGTSAISGDVPVVAEVTSICPGNGNTEEVEQGEPSNGITRMY